MSNLSRGQAPTVIQLDGQELAVESLPANIQKLVQLHTAFSMDLADQQAETTKCQLALDSVEKLLSAEVMKFVKENENQPVDAVIVSETK